MAIQRRHGANRLAQCAASANVNGVMKYGVAKMAAKQPMKMWQWRNGGAAGAWRRG